MKKMTIQEHIETSLILEKCKNELVMLSCNINDKYEIKHSDDILVSLFFLKQELNKIFYKENKNVENLPDIYKVEKFID